MKREKLHPWRALRHTFAGMPRWQKPLFVLSLAFISPFALFVLTATLLALFPVALIEGWEGDTGHAHA